MNTSLLRSAFAAVAIGLASAAASADVVTWTPLSIDGSGNFTVNGIDATITPVPDSGFVAQNVNPQDAAHIEGHLEDLFSTDLTLVAQGECGAGCSGGSTLVGDVFTVTSATAFTAAAIHLGSTELAFQWLSPINSFTLEGFTNISNFRAFNGGVIPLPGAFVLFLSAMGFFGMLRRRFGFGQPAVPAVA
jgi:hypothetical protein